MKARNLKFLIQNLSFFDFKFKNNQKHQSSTKIS